MEKVSFESGVEQRGRLHIVKVVISGVGWVAEW